MPSVQDLITDLHASQAPATKTASAAPAPALGDARTALQQQLAAVTAPAPVKTAAANGVQDVSAVQELTKIASDLADADEAAQVKAAQIYGAAAFDGFLQRANQYAAHAPQQPKVAAVQGNAYATYDSAGHMAKIASELGYAEAENAIARLTSPQAKTAAQQQAYVNQQAAAQHQALVKQAADAGYAEAQQALVQLTTPAAPTKTAAEQDTDGVRAAAEKLAAYSEDCFIRGYESMDQLAQAIG